MAWSATGRYQVVRKVRLTLDGAIHGIDELFRVLQLVQRARGYFSDALCGLRQRWFVCCSCSLRASASGGGAGVGVVGVLCTGRRVDFHGVGSGFVAGRVGDFDGGG